ncbi:MAG: response regulator [Roseiflexaceae bacterium]
MTTTTAEHRMTDMTTTIPHILVVDDEEDIGTWLARNLRRAGYQVSPMTDSQQAWDAFQAHRFDIVITDLKMPRLNGEQLTERIKAHAPRTPVVVLTGHGTQPDVERLLKLGVAWVLYKPLRDVKDLIALIGQLIDLERQAVELVEARDLFDQALVAMSEALLLTDKLGQIVRVNPAALQMLGMAEADVVGQPLAALWVDAETPGMPDQILARAPQGQLTDVEASLRGPSGQIVPVSLSCSVMHDASGAITGMLAVARDVRAVRALTNAIRELSSPVIPIFDHVLVLPLVGHIDSWRAHQIIADLLGGIQLHQARVVILDITGVAVVDTQVAHYLVQAIRAAGLLGTHCLLVGIRPEIATSLVSLGVSLHDIQTSANLEQGVQQALRIVGLEIRQR